MLCYWTRNLNRWRSLYVHLYTRCSYPLFDLSRWNELEHQPCSSYFVLSLHHRHASFLLFNCLYRPRNHPQKTLSRENCKIQEMVFGVLGSRRKQNMLNLSNIQTWEGKSLLDLSKLCGNFRPSLHFCCKLHR